jgi:hypothetical protein
VNGGRVELDSGRDPKLSGGRRTCAGESILFDGPATGIDDGPATGTDDEPATGTVGGPDSAVSVPCERATKLIELICS